MCGLAIANAAPQKKRFRYLTDGSFWAMKYCDDEYTRRYLNHNYSSLPFPNFAIRLFCFSLLFVSLYLSFSFSIFPPAVVVVVASIEPTICRCRVKYKSCLKCYFSVLFSCCWCCFCYVLAFCTRHFGVFRWDR